MMLRSFGRGRLSVACDSRIATASAAVCSRLPLGGGFKTGTINRAAASVPANE